MGFYDNRCMITGVSLKASRAALVVLLPQKSGFVPVMLPVFGVYDRLGSVDGIREDVNTELILAYFRTRQEKGTFVYDAPYFQTEKRNPLTNIEFLLHSFERNLNDGTVATLYNQPLVPALICEQVVDALGANRLSVAIVQQQLQAWYGAAVIQNAGATVSVAREIYPVGSERLADPLRDWANLMHFVQGQGIAWKPDDEPFQHYSTEMRQYLSEARARFHDNPLILTALAAYEQDVEDYL